MRVFEAGATGAIGKQLVPRLVGAGHKVNGLTRSESRQAIAGDLHEALWATFVAHTLPGCSEVSQPGLPSCLDVESTTSGGRT